MKYYRNPRTRNPAANETTETIINEMCQNYTAQTTIVALERSLHRLLSDIDEHALRTGGLTNDEIITMKDSIAQMRMRLYQAGNNAGSQGLAAYRKLVPLP